MASVGELRVMDAKELKRELEDLLSEQFKLRMQLGSGQEIRPHFFRRVRGNIARVHCIIGERERGVAASKEAVAPAKKSRVEREASAVSPVELLSTPQAEPAGAEPVAATVSAEEPSAAAEVAVKGKKKAAKSKRNLKDE